MESLSCLVREQMSILNCIIFGLHDKRFKSFIHDFFLICLIIFYYFSFSTLRLSFCWDCSIDLLVRFSLVLSISFNSLDCISGFVLLCFFLRCVHTFFNDFDRSKRDKQISPAGIKFH